MLNFTIEMEPTAKRFKLECVSCSNCGEEFECDLLFKCKTCDLAESCENCVALCHKEHDIIDFSGLDPVVCPKHKRVGNDFCGECKQVFCCLCWRDHKNHEKYMTVTDLKICTKRKFKKLVAELEIKENSVIQKGNELRKSLNEQKQGREIIRQSCKSMIFSVKNVLEKEVSLFDDYVGNVKKQNLILSEIQKLKEQVSNVSKLPVGELVSIIPCLQQEVSKLSKKQQFETNSNLERYSNAVEHLISQLKHEFYQKFGQPEESRTDDTESQSSGFESFESNESGFVNLQADRSPEADETHHEVARNDMSNDEQDVDETNSNLVATVKEVPRSSSLYFVGCFINNFYKVELTCEGLVKFSDCLIDEESKEFTEKFLGEFLLSDASHKIEHVYAIDHIRFRILVLTEAKEVFIFDSHTHKTDIITYPAYDHFLWPYCLNLVTIHWAYWNPGEKMICFPHRNDLRVPCLAKPTIHMVISAYLCCFFDLESKNLIRVRIDPKIKAPVEVIPHEEHGMDRVDMVSYPFWRDKMALWDMERKCISVLEKCKMSPNVPWSVLKIIFWNTGYETLTTKIRPDLTLMFIPAVEIVHSTEVAGKSRDVTDSASAGTETCQKFVFVATDLVEEKKSTIIKSE